jgi:tRNA (guanine-N7-)-methyltransferase
MYPREAPLEIEIGCGKGRFLLARARACPGHNYLGIDRLLVRLRKASKKIVREGLANVRLLRIEARYAVQYLLPPGCASCVYVLFPDPWPKRRHHRRRLFCPEFLDPLHAVLAKDGRVHVATDHMPYFEEIRALVAGDTRFCSIDPFVPAESERTGFELIFVNQGARIGRCSFRKKATPDGGPLPGPP